MYFQIQIKSKTVRRNTKSPHELAISQRKKNNWKKNIHHSWEMVGNRHITWRFPNYMLGNRHQIWRFLNCIRLRRSDFTRFCNWIEIN